LGGLDAFDCGSFPLGVESGRWEGAGQLCSERLQRKPPNVVGQAVQGVGSEDTTLVLNLADSVT
jgi:hypothetical protein